MGTYEPYGTLDERTKGEGPELAAWLDAARPNPLASPRGERTGPAGPLPIARYDGLAGRPSNPRRPPVAPPRTTVPVPAFVGTNASWRVTPA